VASTPSLSTATIKRLTIDLPPDVHRTLKVRCAGLGVTMVELVRVVIDDALARDDPRLRSLLDGKRRRP
jgi:hypothetical protein